MCAMCDIPVKETVYFQLTGSPGYVQHAKPRTWLTSLLISIAPVIGNVSVALVLLQYSLSELAGSGRAVIAAALVSWWVAIAAIIHSIPSTTDTENIWNATRERWYRTPLAVITGPIYAFRKVGRKIGIYRLTVPLSVVTVIFLFTAHDIPFAAFTACLTDRNWGCWDAPNVLLTAASEFLVASTEILIEWLNDQITGVEFEPSDFSLN